MTPHLNRLVVLTAALAVASTAWAAPLSRSVPARAELKDRSGQGTNLVERLERMGDFTILLAAIRAADLEDAVAEGGPFTLFAPTDRAFGDLLARLQITAQDLLDSPDLANILLHHVAPDRVRARDLLRSSTQATLNPGRPVLVLQEGERVRVSGATVIRPNVAASNGLIHVIDGVLLPPNEPITIQGVADVLVLDGRFTVLLEALRRTGLDDALAGDGPFTVFAPTDDAFEQLLGELNVTAEQLLADPGLADILKYHVLGRRAGTVQLLAARSAPTLQGDSVALRPQQGAIYVDDARIVNPDVHAPNGLIHTIDAVLLP